MNKKAQLTVRCSEEILRQKMLVCLFEKFIGKILDNRSGWIEKERKREEFSSRREGLMNMTREEHSQQKRLKKYVQKAKNELRKSRDCDDLKLSEQLFYILNRDMYKLTKKFHLRLSKDQLDEHQEKNERFEKCKRKIYEQGILNQRLKDAQSRNRVLTVSVEQKSSHMDTLEGNLKTQVDRKQMLNKEKEDLLKELESLNASNPGSSGDGTDSDEDL